MLLHIIEAPDELAVRTLQGVVRIDMIKPSGIDDTEKEIAELIGGFLLVLPGQFCLQFAELFPHLVPYVLFLFPIEADITRLVLNTVSLDERRQSFRHAAQHALVTVFLLQFDLFPILAYLTCRVGLCLAVPGRHRPDPHL